MSGRDSGVESGGSDSSESISMSVGSPAVPESSQDNDDAISSQEENRIVMGLNQGFGLLSFDKSADCGMMSLAASSSYRMEPTCHLNSDHQSSATGIIGSSSTVHSSYEQRDHTSKIRPGSVVQRKLNCRRRRSHVYPLAKDVIDERRLLFASTTNCVINVERLLGDGVDPCAADERQRSSLHFAASKGYTEIAQLLINQGADANQRDIVGNTPLHLAVCTGDVTMVTLLLRAGTDVNALDNSGRTPIHLAQSKLKILQSNTNYSSSQVKNEVLQIIEMMNVFLQRSGKCAQVDILNKFSSRLHQRQTREEVDSDVKDLLSSLTHLSLQ